MLLESIEHNGQIAGLASYTDSSEVIVPMTLAGSTYVVVSSDVRNDVNESNETNNSGSSTSVLRLAAPSDLLVQTIAAPDSARR